MNKIRSQNISSCDKEKALESNIHSLIIYKSASIAIHRQFLWNILGIIKIKKTIKLSASNNIFTFFRCISTFVCFIAPPYAALQKCSHRLRKNENWTAQFLSEKFNLKVFSISYNKEEEEVRRTFLFTYSFFLFRDNGRHNS